MRWCPNWILLKLVPICWYKWENYLFAELLSFLHTTKHEKNLSFLLLLKCSTRYINCYSTSINWLFIIILSIPQLSTSHKYKYNDQLLFPSSHQCDNFRALLVRTRQRISVYYSNFLKSLQISHSGDILTTYARLGTWKTVKGHTKNLFPNKSSQLIAV